MAIKFERDKDGNLVAIDENGKKVGNIVTMGDNVKEEKHPEE